MELQNRISLKAVKVWRINGLISTLIAVVIAIVLTVLTLMFEWKTWVYYITWGIVILYFLYIVFLKPIIGYKWWRYEVREDEIEIQYGFFIVERTLVPMVRVQHVDTIQGPIMRRYNLASVEVSTAATVHVIPALEYEEAEQIRYYISKMVQTVKEDV